MPISSWLSFSVTLSRLATLALLALLTDAGVSWAYRDGGCFAPPPPSVFGGVGLPARDAGHAMAIARRLGLGTRSCWDPNEWWVEGVQLGPTVLSWHIHGFGSPVLGLPTTGVTPLLHPMVDRGCPWYAPMTAEQPAGARQVTRAIAVVSDLEATCDAEVYSGTWPRHHLTFGPPFEIPWLGARAREVRLAHGALRVIEPVHPNGIAARWLAAGGPRWLGVTIEVEDLARAALVLEGRGVPILRGSDGGRPLLVVEPEEAGGTLVEFVASSPF